MYFKSVLHVSVVCEIWGVVVQRLLRKEGGGGGGKLLFESRPCMGSGNLEQYSATR